MEKFYRLLRLPKASLDLHCAQAEALDFLSLADAPPTLAE